MNTSIQQTNFEILDTIRSGCEFINQTNSSKDKLRRLDGWYNALNITENEKWWIRWALLNTYSPYIKFGVTSEQVKKWVANQSSLSIFSDEMDVMQLLEHLANRSLTGYNALEAIYNTICNQPENCREVLYNILDKNLKIRMDAKSINKVIPDLIPIFEVSLCNVYFERQHKVDFQKDMWLASRKLDGCVSGDTLISVEGGKSLPIKTIVENKMDIKVLTYNTETNKTEYKPIKNHMKNMDDVNEQTHQWFELELEDGRKLKVTGNHKIYLPELQCWRRVDELTENDMLLII